MGFASSVRNERAAGRERQAAQSAFAWGERGDAAVKQGDRWYRSTQNARAKAGVGGLSCRARGSRGEGEREERGAGAGEAVGGV